MSDCFYALNIKLSNCHLSKRVFFSRITHYLEGLLGLLAPTSASNKEKRLHTCLFGVIGLDAAHVRRLLGHEDLHEFRQTGFELGGRLEGQTQGHRRNGRTLVREMSGTEQASR